MSTTIVKFEAGKSHIVYKKKDGTRVPGASTIAKIGDSPEALINWAWRLGTEGKDYKAARDSAADSGTLAHFLIQCHLAAVQADIADFPKPVVDRAENGFLHFLDFWHESGFEPVASEKPFVSEDHGFGGTLDLVAEDAEGHQILFDFKTSDRIYQAHLSQLSAYEILWNEHNFAKPIWRRAIVRIPKTEAGDFEVRWLSNVERWWALFKCQLALYNAQKCCKVDE